MFPRNIYIYYIIYNISKKRAVGLFFIISFNIIRRAIDFSSNWGNPNKCGAFPIEIWIFGDRIFFWDHSFGHVHMAGSGIPSKTFSNRSSYVSSFCMACLQKPGVYCHCFRRCLKNQTLVATY